MNNLTDDARGGNLNLTTAALSGLSGAASTYSTTGTQSYSIDGRFYTTAADSGVATPTADATTGAAFLPLANGKQCLFVFGWIAAGTLVVSQGPIVNTADVVAGSSALHFPRIPNTMTPFAYVSVANANATSWLFGTGLWNAATLTVGTAVNCMLLPPEPLTAATA